MKAVYGLTASFIDNNVMGLVKSFFSGYVYLVYGVTVSFCRRLFKRRKKMDHPIDFVVSWVDGSDPAWQQEKEAFEALSRPEGDAIVPARFRDWDIFRHWFRAVEKYAPWVRYVFLITNGQLPEWINLNSPKLKVVFHRDYIPSEFLPTFNSSTIELCLHRIEALSEHFVYFNDDFIITNHLDAEDFFQEDKPVLCTAGSPVRNYEHNDSFYHRLFSALGLVSGLNWPRYYRAHPDQWFSYTNGFNLFYNLKDFQADRMSGVYFPHLCQPLRKKTMTRAWDLYANALRSSCSHRFRNALDLNRYLFAILDIYSGEIVPCTPTLLGDYTEIKLDNSLLFHNLRTHRDKITCLNDTSAIPDSAFEATKGLVVSVLDELFPDKSSFEKE